MKTAPMEFPTTGSKKILQFLCHHKPYDSVHMYIVVECGAAWATQQISWFKEKNLLILPEKSFRENFFK